MNVSWSNNGQTVEFNEAALENMALDMVKQREFDKALCVKPKETRFTRWVNYRLGYFLPREFRFRPTLEQQIEALEKCKWGAIAIAPIPREKASKSI